jgi:hypothetical protein
VYQNTTLKQNQTKYRKTKEAKTNIKKKEGLNINKSSTTAIFKSLIYNFIFSPQILVFKFDWRMTRGALCYFCGQ